MGELNFGRLADSTEPPSNEQLTKMNSLNKDSYESEVTAASGIAASIKAKYFSLDSNIDIEFGVNGKNQENDVEDSSDEANGYEPKTLVSNFADKTTQIGYRDMREILGERIRETEVQTDIRMIHELQAPNKLAIMRQQQSLSSRSDTKEVQTEQSGPTAPHPPLVSQSSVEEDPNAPIDRNKLGKRVRRHVKPGCSIAVLPSSEIIIVDPESNCMTVLDRRGKFRFGISNANKPCTESGHPSAIAANSSAFVHLTKLERGIRIATPQGNLIIKLENEPVAVSSPTPTTESSAE